MILNFITDYEPNYVGHDLYVSMRWEGFQLLVISDS